MLLPYAECTIKGTISSNTAEGFLSSYPNEELICLPDYIRVYPAGFADISHSLDQKTVYLRSKFTLRYIGCFFISNGIPAQDVGGRSVIIPNLW